MTKTTIHADHLVFGLLFLTIASVWGLAEWGVVKTSDLDVIVPVGLVVAGLGGIVAFIVNRTSTRRN